MTCPCGNSVGLIEAIAQLTIAKKGIRKYKNTLKVLAKK